MTDLPIPGGPGAAAAVRAREARQVLLVSLAVTAALYVVPGGRFVAYPLLLLSTFVHEMAHGLAAILVGGQFVDLQVFADGSGVARTRSQPGALRQAWIAAGGLIGPAVAAAIGFTLGRRAQTARIALLVGGLLLVVGTVVWVRSLTGWLVAIGLIGISLGVAAWPRSARPAQLWLVFTSVQLALSAFSRRDYLFAESATTGAGTGLSDSAAIADALIGPYWFWGAVCGLISVAVLAYGTALYVRAAAGRVDGDG
jgi:hypothetical protein